MSKKDYVERLLVGTGEPNPMGREMLEYMRANGKVDALNDFLRWFFEYEPEPGAEGLTVGEAKRQFGVEWPPPSPKSEEEA